MTHIFNVTVFTLFYGNRVISKNGLINHSIGHAMIISVFIPTKGYITVLVVSATFATRMVQFLQYQSYQGAFEH